MVTRRSLLIGGAMLATGLAGCSQRQSETLAIQFLKDSVPAQVLGQFEQEIKGQAAGLQFLPVDQLDQLFAQLQRWKDEPPKADLVTLGDFWLTPAIQQGLIRPISTEGLSGWESLPNRWQEWATRNPQGQPQRTGQVWGVPYAWGNLAIAYRPEDLDPLGQPPVDWSDLWRPELTGQISLPDSARIVIGLVLKSLGESVNTPNPEAVAGLTERLSQLHQQVKVYSSSAYLQPLLLGDTWLAVGWSTDLWPLVKRDRRFKMVVPSSGTLLTADLWVRPSQNRENASPDADRLIQHWLDFGLKPETALQLSLLGSAIAPQFLVEANPPEALRSRLLSANVLDRSEFLDVLSAQATAQYRDLWVKVRQQAHR
jgi:putative spermidine/putrescine transport system substrate-binding protein